MAELTVDQQRAIAIARARRAREGQGSGNNRSKSGEWGTFNEAMDMATGGLMVKGNAAVGGLLDAGLGAVQGEGWNYSDNYNKWLERQRQAQADYNEENPIRSGVGKGAGLGLAITQFPVFGSGYTGAAGTGAAYGALMGAGQDADSLPERAQNAVVGGLTGGGIGAAGYGLGSLAAAGANKVSRAWQAFNADPQTRAAMQIRGLADDAGGQQAVTQAVDALGPDAMIVDALGERGLAVGRQSANISPSARETLEAALLGRKAGQNARVVSDMERLSGLPVGNRKNVDTLKREAYDAVKPQINAAYREARKAGAEIDFKEFDNIITTPIGRKAFQQALENVTSRAARNPDAGGNLAVLDETKRLLDGYAKQGYAQKDPMASEYADAAAALRNRLDELLSGDEYAVARSLRQKAFRADDAFDLGDELGSSRVGLDVPGRVAKVDPENRSKVAQAYAARKADTLLNRGSTDGALNELSTPMGREAADAALGKGALKKTVDREKAFNQTVKALTGNSTSVRQMVEMGLTGLGTGSAMSLLTGDPWSGGAAGIMAALARKGAPALAKKLATDSQKSAAPIIAEMLTRRGLPPELQKLAPGTLEKLAKAGDDKLVKALLLIAADQQKAQPKQAGAR